MAGPTVKMIFEGDATDLEQAVDGVGSSTRRMADEVGESSRRAGEEGSSALGKIGDRADDSESKFQGMADTITGFGDVAQGFKDGDVVTMATGFADLAGGITDFAVPALSAFAGFLKGPLSAAMAFVAANPIVLIIAAVVALIGAFIWAYNNVEWFRNGVDAAMAWISNAVGAAVDWIVGAWNNVVGFFSSIPARIGAALGSIGSFIGNAFKGALNQAIGWLNWGIDKINFLIGGINAVNPFGQIGLIPHIPRFHSGGVVPGPPGSEMLAILQAGETVIPAGSSGGGGGRTVNFVGKTGDILNRYIMEQIRAGQIQIA